MSCAELHEAGDSVECTDCAHAVLGATLIRHPLVCSNFAPSWPRVDTLGAECGMSSIKYSIFAMASLVMVFRINDPIFH